MQRIFGETRALECPICLEEFLEPRLLPCGHTFCTSCLRQLIRELGQMRHFFNQTFRCPLCRKSLAVPSMGAQGFPSDVSVVDALINNRAVQRLSRSWTPERNATTPQRINQPEVNNASGENKYVIAFLIFAFIILSFSNHGSENNVSSPSRKLTSVFNITTKSGHLTMSLNNNELFVINPATSQGEIRERATLKSKSIWNVSDLYSIAGYSLCKKNKYIYVSTTKNTILKFDSDGDIVARWSTGGIRGRPGLTADCNVALIPHDNTTKIFLYTPIGDLIRIIQLKMNIGGSRLNCAFQLRNGNFVISYGTDQDKEHGVILIDSEGNVVRYFGGIKGEGTHQVNGAYDLIADGSGNVYVVDHNNHRILQLNSHLQYVGEILSAESGLRFPHGVVFDDLYGRLFVMGSTWDDTKSRVTSGKIMVFEAQ